VENPEASKHAIVDKEVIEPMNLTDDELAEIGIVKVGREEYRRRSEVADIDVE